MRKALVAVAVSAAVIVVPSSAVGCPAGSVGSPSDGGCYLNVYRLTRYNNHAVGDASLNCGWGTKLVGALGQAQGVL